MTHRHASSSRLLRPSVLGAASALLLGACDSGTASREPAEGFPATGEIQLQLTRANDCGDLLSTIQDNVIAQLGERAKQLRSADGYGSDVGRPGFAVGGTVDVDSSVNEPERGLATSPPPAASPTPNGGDGESVDGNNLGTDPVAPAPGPAAPQDEGAPQGEEVPREDGEFSGTTVQVKDVDEADIVKTDGNFMYLLHGATLFVLNAWPAAATEIVTSSAIEGEPVEMFVHQGKAVVFSRVYLDPSVTGGAPADPYRGYSASYTKVTVLDVALATPGVVRESYLEGDYISARRHDGVVRAVVQDGFKVPPLGNPAIEYRDPFGQPYPQADIDAQVDAWLERTVRSIRSTDLGDWLPRELSAESGRLVAQAPRCGDYYAPDAGLTESGVTSVVALDLDDLSGALSGATILGRAERVYSNEDVVLITQSDYRFMWSADAREQTVIHRFDIAGAETSYTASGAVAGSIHDQFSLDERAGVIAVSTTEQRLGSIDGRTDNAVEPVPTPGPVADIARPQPALPAQPNGPVNRIVTLRADGLSLEQIGSTEDFGATEQIFATRFMGDRAYVVTFRRTDPLFVVDMEDPTNPHVVGELHIPGFSDYMFPLGSDHLFAIGRDATATGVTQGLALQIFDVSDPAAPALAHRYVFEDLGDSPANIDHRAISFHADRDVVAFPHRSWNTGESTLEVFQISTTDGFTRVGGMGMPETVDLEQCLVSYGYFAGDVPELLPQVEANPDWEREILASCRYSQSFRRGLFRDDIVYGVSTTGVYAYELDALGAGPVGQVSLPAPIYSGGGYRGGGTDPGGFATPPRASADPPVDATEPAPVTNGGGADGADGSMTPAAETQAAEDDAAEQIEE